LGFEVTSDSFDRVLCEDLLGPILLVGLARLGILLGLFISVGVRILVLFTVYQPHQLTEMKIDLWLSTKNEISSAVFYP